MNVMERCQSLPPLFFHMTIGLNTQPGFGTQPRNTCTPSDAALHNLVHISHHYGVILTHCYTITFIPHPVLIWTHHDIVAVEVVYKDSYLPPGSLSRPLGHWGLGMCCTHYLF